MYCYSGVFPDFNEAGIKDKVNTLNFQINPFILRLCDSY